MMFPPKKLDFTPLSMSKRLASNVGIPIGKHLPVFSIFATRLQQRSLSLHEYQSMSLFKEYKIDHTKGDLCTHAEESKSLFPKYTTDKGCILKAQVHAGGRGKGSWMISRGLIGGGIQRASSSDEAFSKVSKMLGNKLITRQTGPSGRPCSKVYICESVLPIKEFYLAMLYDRKSKTPMLMGSSQGGMDIEEVAATNPKAIHTMTVDIFKGLSLEEAKGFSASLGFTGEHLELAAGSIHKLYKIFIEKDASLIEINPLAIIDSVTPRVICLDAKITIDENADFRQKDLFLQKDSEQEDPREVMASKAKINYIGLDGSIGCLVNGAGLAMATMDIIKLHGGDPANFLDVGGSASVDQVSEAFAILISDKKVSSILVNIFGGIMRCDIIAGGIVKAASSLNITIPLIVRLQGTNVDEAKKILNESSLKIFSIEDLTEAARKSVELAKDPSSLPV